MNALNTMNNEIKTMSSVEIAELTGKDHSSVVMRDIRNMIEELGIDAAKVQSQYQGSRRMEKCYKLDKELTMTLITGYSIKLRHAIIKRWEQLEQAIDAIAETNTHEEALSIAYIAQEQRKALRLGHKEDTQRIAQAIANGTLEAAGREHNFIFTRVSMYLFGCAPCMFKRNTGMDMRDYFESIGDIETLALIAKTTENIITLSEVGFTKDQLMQKFEANKVKYFQ